MPFLSLGGFARSIGVGGIDRIVLVDRRSADAAEFPIFAEKFFVRIEDLNPVVGAIRHDQTSVRIERHRVRAELAGAGTQLPETPEKLSRLVEHGDPPDNFGRVSDAWLSAT